MLKISDIRKRERNLQREVAGAVWETARSIVWPE